MPIRDDLIVIQVTLLGRVSRIAFGREFRKGYQTNFFSQILTAGLEARIWPNVFSFPVKNFDNSCQISTIEKPILVPWDAKTLTVWISRLVETFLAFSI